MQTAVNIAIVLATVSAMEIVAAATHRYLMHGPGWSWHRTHHEHRDGIFELNDLYAVFFAGGALAITLLASPSGPVYWVGIGMAVYGCLYFVVHDGLVHGRWPFRVVPRNAYLKRLVQAHRLHHAVEGRDGSVSFGFLYARPVRDLKRRLRDRGGPTRREDAR